ncbi:MAG: cytochrome c [Nitrospirae bacterium]|nr:MAG: cytochrome c [Nitrospirota bacterium]
MTWLKLVEGYMPMQMIAELTLCILFFAALNYMLKKAGMGIPKFWAGIGVWVFIQLYLKYRIYPPLPFSIRAIYGTVSLCGIFMWVSGSQAEWEEFRRPILDVLDGKTPLHRAVRAVLLVALPIGLGAFAFNSFKPSFEEPIELRTVHPAPPATTKVHGKTYVLQVAQNPYRVNKEGKYDQEYTNAHITEQAMGRLMKSLGPEDNPWNPNAEGYIKYVREGGEIFFQNCHFCHGDNLNGRGLWAYAFNPIPANFTDAGTIAQLQETFVFWRVAKGGIGLPGEGFPWASVMPPWEQHLTVDEIWKVIMFEYWHTGYYPRTWD